MTHPEMDELYELYVLGTLEPELAAEIDQHLEAGCEYCTEKLQDAAWLAALMAGIVEPKTPPRELRKRVHSLVAGLKPQRSWRAVVMALSAACVGLILFSVWSAWQLHTLRGELAAADRERNELQTALEILSRYDTRTVQFGLAEAPHGRVFVNRNGGLLFVGSQLPPLPQNRTYELWLVPAKGAPRPAGLFRPDAKGDSVNVSTVPVNPEEITAVAVSVEPRLGSSAPTTKPFLVVPLG